jgi:flagellar hook-associated protein FlgK
LVPHLASQEPYDPYRDPDNIEVKFVKATQMTSEITSSVKFNDDPGRMKWEITITLPTDSLGNVNVTAQELIDYVNSERSQSAADGINYLPPRTSGWKVGDFISAEGTLNQNTTGRVNFVGPTYPQGHEEKSFFTLDRSLKYVTPQGSHLSYGSEYATLKTTLVHTDNDIIYSAVDKGEAGEKISVEYVNAGPNQNLRVDAIAGENGEWSIRVTLGTDQGGAVTTTAGQIVSAVNSHSVARTLVTAETPADQSGLGAAREMEKTYLSRSGFFEVVVYEEGKEPVFHQVTVTPDDSLADVIAELSDISGLRVESITDRHGKDTLRIIADDGVSWGFAGDSSGALAVLGFNNIFTGSTGADVGVNQLLIDNREYINAGRIDSNGVRAPGDNSNALDMADLKDKRISFYHQSSATIGSMHNAIYSNIGATAQGITRDYEFTEGVYAQLQSRQDSIAGVNLDEELADVLRFQYMYQCSAKMISTIDSMMETLLSMR